MFFDRSLNWRLTNSQWMASQNYPITLMFNELVQCQWSEFLFLTNIFAIYFSFIVIKNKNFIIFTLCSLSWRHSWTVCDQLLLLWTVGHVATFTVTAALVAGQWQHYAQSFPLHPPINAEERRAWQASSIVFQVFDLTRPWFKPNLSASVSHALSQGWANSGPWKNSGNMFEFESSFNLSQ